MYDNVKEVYVGVVAKPDGKGGVIAGHLWLAGRPVPAGIYTADNIPKHLTWEQFCALAIQYHGKGFHVVYEGEENREVKSALTDHADMIKRQEREQEAVLAKMKNGRHVKKAEKPEVIPNG